MIMPSDKDYQETKLIKQGRKQLITPFRELANWISEKFQVNVLNIYYDFIQPNDRPRLNIIFEYRDDELNFRTHPNGNYDEKKQKVIADKFKEIIDKKTYQANALWGLLKKKSATKYDTKNIWVIFSSFEPIALIEAN